MRVRKLEMGLKARKFGVCKVGFGFCPVATDVESLTVRKIQALKDVEFDSLKV